MYYDSNKLYSAFTIHSNLKRIYGINVNHKRVERLMSIYDLKSVFRKKKTHHYNKTKPEETAENILNRNFSPERPNEVWLTDITEDHIGTHKEYICTVFDPFDNMPISQVSSTRNDTTLTNEALDKAHDLYPEATPMFHSDRGFQFTRAAFKHKLKELGYTQSMSRVSRCIDNSPMECFQGVMKDEMKILFPYTTAEEYRQSLDKYLHHYIYERPQRRFKGKTPFEVRSESLNKENPQTYPTLKNYGVIKYWNKINTINQQGTAL